MSTALITINAGELLAEARSDMELGVVRHLPVVDDRGKLVGIVSDRDLVRTAAKRKVSDVMSRDVVTTRPETPAHVAASLMLDNRIGSVPVVNDGGDLVGVVTVTDYLELARRALLGLPLQR
jgi:CBS domain-containing protein